MKKVLLVGILVICMMSLPGCEIMSAITADMNQAAGTTAAAKLIASSDGLFSMEIPSGWEQAEASTYNPLACIGVQNNEEKMAFMAIMESKEDFVINLEGYRDIVVANNEALYATSMGEPVATTLGAYNAYKYEAYITAADGSVMYMIMYIIETPNHFGQLYAMTLKSMETENKAELESVSNTFKVN